MARTIDRLSAVKVAALKKPGMYLDGAGLYLQISKFKTKSWVFRFKSPVTGRVRDMGLGGYPAVSLAAARELAEPCRIALAARRDPLQDRQQAVTEARLAAASTKTFDWCAEAYIAAHEKGWKNRKHQWQWRRSLEAFAGPKIGNMPMAAITTADVMRVLTPIWSDKTETASRVRQRIERVWSWAKAHGYCEGDNPARWRGHLDNLLPKKSAVAPKQHHRALPYAEIGAFMAALAERPALAARALEFTILTAARSGEALGATWAEIDFDTKTWEVPAGRMKGGRAHKVPLSDAALAVLRPLHENRISNRVFPGNKGKPLSDMSMIMLLRRMSRADIVVHGFRSSFRDWAAEQTSFGNHVCEMALAHAIGNDVEAAYRRGDLFEKRRRLMDAWAGYCARPSAKPAAEIVTLHGAA